MPPKKQEAPTGIACPEVEEEVRLPEGVAPVPEPSFCLVLGHLAGHQFRVEEPPKPIGEEPQEEGLPALVDFDPRSVLVARAKEQEDLFSKRVLVLEREELQALKEEDKPLSSVIRARVEKERLARSRHKSNEARRRAIAAQTATESEETPASKKAEGPRADFVVLLPDYPANEAELQELAAEGLGAAGLVDLWALLWLAGESMNEAEEGALDRTSTALDPPELVQLFSGAIQAAGLGDEATGLMISTVRNTHTLGFPPEGTSPGEHVQSFVLETLNFEVASKLRFRKWLEEPVRVSLPDLGENDKACESRLYQRMMSSVDPSHHDVPFFLHCLTEQVDRTLTGEAQREEDTVALSSLQEYLGAAYDDVITEGTGMAPHLRRPGSSQGVEKMPVSRGEHEATTREEVPMLPFMDHGTRAHHLAVGGVEQPILGGDSVVDAVRKILAEVSAPGVKRSGLPQDAVHSTAQRQALQSRIYPFAPTVPSAEMEQMLLLNAFEELLNRAQPERTWNLSDRCYHELIPKELLGQTLQAALQGGPLVDTAYLPRNDCLLVALHYRSLPGHVMWHSWKGDLLNLPVSDRWHDGLFTTPTFNDWCQVFGGGAEGLKVPLPQPKFLLEGFDARELGYSGLVEKIATPSDGSVIIVTRIEYGLERSFRPPSNAVPEPFQENDDGASVSQADDARSAATGFTAAMRDEEGTESKAPAFTRYEALCRYNSRSARVLKDGLAFGMVGDKSWALWQQTEGDKLTKVPTAEGVAAVGEGDGAAEVGASSGQAVPFEGVDFGSLWLAFPSGARCTARMHHEHADLPEISADAPVPTAEALPPMGVLLTYTTVTGQVIQVFGDGSVRLTWPSGFGDGAGVAQVTTSAASSGEAPVLGDAPRFVPGCVEDVEVMRTVTPSGALIRRLLSGREEIYHPDGTTAVRNPTMKELSARLKELRAGPFKEAERPRLELLERLFQVYAATWAGPLVEAPGEKEKASGLPGHWLVVRPDGRVFGRAPATATEAAEAGTGAEAEGDGSVGADAVAAGTETAVPSLQELLAPSMLVDKGTIIEYEVTGISVAQQVDLQTQQKTLTNARGLASFEDPQGIQRVSLHIDGTQITKTKREDGFDIAIFKEPMAQIRCQITDFGRDMGMKTVVECADGTRFEVVPQVLGPGSKLTPLRPCGQDSQSKSGHAEVSLTTREGARVVSRGAGEVEIYSGAEPRNTEAPTGVYKALCHEGKLCLRDTKGTDFVLRGDQSLVINGSFRSMPGDEDAPPQSPRCLTQGQAYRLPGAESFFQPEVVPPPRLFVVYGSGEAEELLSKADAEALVQAAEEDSLAQDLRQTLSVLQTESITSHTILRSKFTDSTSVPMAPSSVPLPEGLDAGGSMASLFTLASGHASSQAGPTLTEYRQLIQYQPVTEEVRAMFRGTLKQYRTWEATQVAKSRAIMAPPEVKGKKDQKKDRKADKKEDKKDKKGGKKDKKASLLLPEISEFDVMAAPVEPTFVPDLNAKLAPFEHHVQVLRLRADWRAMLPGQDLLRQALAGKDKDAAEADQAMSGMELIAEEASAEAADRSMESTAALEPRAESPKQPTMPTPLAQEAENAGAFATSDSMDGTTEPKMGKSGSKTGRMAVSETEFPFAYFKSEMGLQFLMDAGELDPERKPAPPKPRGLGAAKKRAATAQMPRSPWEPRLVGELSPEEEQAQAEAGNEAGGQDRRSEAWGPGELYSIHATGDSPTKDVEEGGERIPFAPGSRLPIAPERQEAPVGPHPDKKGAIWDVYGEPRPQKAPVSQAFVSINQDYLEVEGATDRRVRTTSIAHKKNATKAPSVSTVRKAGAHTMGWGTDLGAKEILGDMGLTGNPDEHWKLTSTMQGLGDSNNLVEVTPGACRFGPLRLGSLYRSTFFLRNLDVDVTRYTIVPVQSNFVSVKYTPGHLAPGMAVKVEVEIACIEPAKIEQLVEVRLKAHVVRVPVTARIFDSQEYDRLDAESLALHGRRIGRHRERTDNKPPPVEWVMDEAYCRKVFESKQAHYIPPPPEFEDLE